MPTAVFGHWGDCVLTTAHAQRAEAIKDGGVMKARQFFPLLVTGNTAFSVCFNVYQLQCWRRVGRCHPKGNEFTRSKTDIRVYTPSPTENCSACNWLNTAYCVYTGHDVRLVVLSEHTNIIVTSRRFDAASCYSSGGLWTRGLRQWREVHLELLGQT